MKQPILLKYVRMENLSKIDTETSGISPGILASEKDNDKIIIFFMKSKMYNYCLSSRAYRI